MTETTLWLLPLALGAMFGIVNAWRMGLRWSWCLVVQHGIVLIVALTGLYILPKWDWLCSYIGWLFMLGYTVVARIILMKITQDLGLLRTEKAISKARILRLFMWGPPGQFWLDLAHLINFYLRHDTKSANALCKKWHDFGLSRSIYDSLTSYAMLGLLVMRDWEGAVEKYEEVKARYETELASGKKNARFPFQIAVPAMRAFSELGRYKQAREALILADLPSATYGRESLETVFLSFFAMLGSEKDLHDLMNSVSANKGALPEHVRLYWQARCAAEHYDYQAAVLKYAESLRKTPEKDLAWRERTQHQIKQNQEIMVSERAREPDLEKDADKAAAAATARQIMDRCFVVAEILNSRKPPLAVRVLTGVISVMFIYSYYPYLLNEKSSFAFDYGYLAGNVVMAGQWWRLITYIFLHNGFPHLLMNLFGLVWFGRFVENIFGSGRFLVIFFLTGVFSGALQMVLSAPDDRTVGASGAVLGIFGAGLAAMWRLKNVLPAQIRRHELSWMIALAVTQLVFDQVVNLLFPGNAAAHDAIHIASAAHFGGMISGFALGWILPLRKLSRDN